MDHVAYLSYRRGVHDLVRIKNWKKYKMFTFTTGFGHHDACYYLPRAFIESSCIDRSTELNLFVLIMLGLHWDHAFHVLHDSKKRGRSWTSWNLLFIFSVTTS